jgi:hypothetical protein
MVTDRGVAERFIDDLVASGLTTDAKDPGMKGVSRVGRLPMGLNNKLKYQEGGNKAPEVYGSDFTGQRFTLTGLAEAFGLPDPFRPVVVKTYGTQYSDIDAVPMVYRLTEKFLFQMGMVKHDSGDEVLEITCPWLSGHGIKGNGPDDSGSKYFRPSTNNGFKGGFYCWHGKCQGRNIQHLTAWVESTAQAIAAERLLKKEVI